MQKKCFANVFRFIVQYICNHGLDDLYQSASAAPFSINQSINPRLFQTSL